jgi:hypothetical protein
MGHRRSIDFDLFKFSDLNAKKTIKKIDTTKIPYIITRRVIGQINMVINSVKVTFFQYPYTIDAPIIFENFLKMPDLLSLAAMKAYALGRRSKCKDYVDLYFMLRNYYTIDEDSKKANILFDQMFSEKLFRAQITYHKDIDHSEPIEYMQGFEVNEQEVKDFLTEASLKDIFSV